MAGRGHAPVAEKVDHFPSVDFVHRRIQIDGFEKLGIVSSGRHERIRIDPGLVICGGFSVNIKSQVQTRSQIEKIDDCDIYHKNITLRSVINNCS